MSPPRTRPWRSALFAVACLAALSLVAVEPPAGQEQRAANDTLTGDGSSSGNGSTAGGGPNLGGNGGTSPVGGGGATTGPGGTGGTVRNGQRLECRAGANGGSTDKGVTGGRIKLAATNVRSGTGSSFLGTSYIGMQAVVNRVNAQGGICGRLLDLRLVDDGWEAARGATFLQNFAKGDYFALPVVPSSEGLTQAIVNKTIRNAGIPVVGTDGMLKEQYSDPWVWPVATSTVSTMRIMAKHAYDKGARSFGIVFDQQYRFGKEGASAFRTYVQSLSGARVTSYVGITPGKANYSGDANRFNTDCGVDRCDFVAMLLDPTTANTYIASQTDKDGVRQGFGKFLTGGAQPLFNERFARDCGRPCDNMLVWTGYNPPVGRLASDPDVAAYVREVRSVDPGVDVNNQFLEGAYLGMRVFVEALKKVGPNLTRTALRDALNTTQFTSSIASSLRWSPEKRFANLCAQAFRIVTASGSFAGFAEAGTGFLCDPTPGVVPRD